MLYAAVQAHADSKLQSPFVYLAPDSLGLVLTYFTSIIYNIFINETWLWKWGYEESITYKKGISHSQEISLVLY